MGGEGKWKWELTEYFGETDEFSFLQLCVMHPLHHALVIGLIAPPFILYI